MVGYARVSMSDQNNQRQIDALKAFGVAECDIFLDKASGRTMQRPGWVALWKELRAGDLLVVQAVDRLGRDVSELFRTLRALHDLGCELKVLSMDLDTRTPGGRLIYGVLALVAQWEREMIVERTTDGLRKAAARGIRGGRRTKRSDEAYLKASELGIKPGARSLGVSANGFRKALARIAKKQLGDGVKNAD